MIRTISAASAAIAAITSGATSTPSWLTNRAARSIRSGSSPNDSSGAAGVRSRPRARSASPPYGSTKPRSTTETAIAFMVKSRRSRSCSTESPYSTCGLRLTRSYRSARKVVISQAWPHTWAPMVP